MLPINIDSLSSYLKPPMGYRFDEGIATTYSLHLDVLLTIPMFLDGALSEKNAVIQNYQAVVMTINHIREKLKIYVQQGEIKTSSLGSKKASKLYELLRPMIIEVEKDTTKASFHPKLWLLRYETKEKKDKKYKLIILSKNLTNSKDLDIAVVLDGSVVDQSIHSKINEKIVGFIDHTLGNKSFNRVELSKVQWENVDGFDLMNLFILPQDISSIPFIENQKITSNAIVFSPFLSYDIFNTSNKNLLVTREDELNKNICDSIYKVNDSLIENEADDTVIDLFSADTSLATSSKINQLHAKIYITPQYLAFGSANATRRGFFTNNEVLILLKHNNQKLYYEQIKSYIEDEKNKVFIKINLSEINENNVDTESQKILEELDVLKRNILKCCINAEYSSGYLKFISTILNTTENIDIHITPASKNDQKRVEPVLTWKVDASEITGWFRFILSKNGIHREFLMDSKFQVGSEYQKAIQDEAAKKSNHFLEANIFALLNDGRIGTAESRENLNEEKDKNHCHKKNLDSDILDLMLDRYASNKMVYSEVLKLMNYTESYKQLLNILPKIKA